MDRLIAQHRGRIANTAGDSVLAEFPSVVEAVKCAVEVQQALTEANEEVPEDRRMTFRIGVHVGDVMVQGADLLWGWCERSGPPPGSRGPWWGLPIRRGTSVCSEGLTARLRGPRAPIRSEH